VNTTNEESRNDFDEDRSRRQRLYERLLCSGASTAEDAYDLICNAILEWSQATMVCLWLYNKLSKQYSLAAMKVLPGRIGYTEVPHCDPDSLCAYISYTRQPHCVHDVRYWEETRSEHVFRCATVQQLEAAGLHSVVGIPMLPDARPDAELHPDGVISLHFPSFSDVPDGCRVESASDTPRSDNPQTTSLLLLGRLASIQITKLRRGQQVDLSRKISDLIDVHLTRFQHDPKMVRRDFLNDLIQLLKEHLNIQAISIFWRLPFSRSIGCVATTGLVRLSDGRPLRTFSEQSWAVYDLKDLADHDEPWTATVYRKGQYDLRSAAEVREHSTRAVYTEIIGNTPIHGDLNDPRSVASPVLLAPMPWKEPGSQSEIFGVLRCGHRPSAQFTDELKTFDTVELEVIRYVINQVTPVLRTLESRIAREDAISIVKHDMAAPIVTIRDVVDELEYQFRGQMTTDIKYSLANLQETALALRGLIDRLAREHEEKLVVRPRKTNIESDIVARLKRMLTPFARETSDMHIVFSGLDDLPSLNIDRDLIERALYNLLINAIKYGDRGTAIRIVGLTLDDGSGYALDVENVGQGVDDEDVPNLFRMYYRSRRAIATRAGSGMGLAIVRQIMRSHSGNALLVHSKNPTVFRLLFPRQLAT